MMVLVCVVVATSGLPATGASPLEFDFEKRVSAQSAIEGVYWQHRNWPSGNPGPKPPLDQVLPESVLRARVEDYMLQSKALERLWGRPIRGEELKAEVERMVASSRAPEVLQEIFAALGNDPILVAECLARPLVADRLIREAYANDPRYHLALKTAIEESLARQPIVAEHHDESEYSEAVWLLAGGRPERARTLAGGRVVHMNVDSWRRSLARLQAGFEPGSPGSIHRAPSGAMPAQGEARTGDLPLGIFSRLQEDDESFFVQAVLEKGDARIRVATMAWRKTPFDEWWAGTKATLDSSSFAGDGNVTTVGLDSFGEVPSLSAPTTACTPDTWMAVQSSGAPSPRELFTAVWTGAEMIVWGGYNGLSGLDTNTGGRYVPATDSWTPTSTTGAPETRDSHTAVWAGTKMVVWGGGDEIFTPKNTGGRYDPTTNSWLPTTTTGSPAARLYHTAVWSGSKMVVWGGYNGTRDIDTGGLYDPTADSWVATATTGAPSARDSHTAVWGGTTMLVWGGENDRAVAQDTGGRFNPVANTWSAMATTGAPAARWYHTAVWNGSTMIVWGGFDDTFALNTGGIYNPSTNTWTPTSTTGAPASRQQHVAVWADSFSEMIVWGGQDDIGAQLDSGGRYNLTTDAWAATSTVGAPISGRDGAVVWTGSEMITWGGWNLVDLNSGGRYCLSACASPPPTGTADLSVSRQAGGELVSWSAIPGADAYDLVRGSINQLIASGGNFTTSTQACLANDQVAASYLDPDTPALGSGFLYLVRGVSCGGAGTYDSLSGSQIGSRDSEINASPSSCP